MDAVDKTVTTVTQHRWFTFTQEEAMVLREAMLNQIDWEETCQGKYYDFFLGFYEALADVEYPS